MRPPAVVRWRCLLCHPLRWRIGTMADWQYHYQILHNQEPPDGD